LDKRLYPPDPDGGIAGSECPHTSMRGTGET
jgi:hypothetical protein